MSGPPVLRVEATLAYSEKMSPGEQEELRRLLQQFIANK